MDKVNSIDDETSSRVISDTGFSLESSITRASKLVKKGQPIIIMAPGKVSMHFDLPTFTYDNDEQLYTWLNNCLQKKVVLLVPSDEKIARVNDIALCLHLPIFVVNDLPDQDITGTAKSFISHHDRVSYTEVGFISPETAESIKNDLQSSFATSVPVESHHDSNQGSKRFNSIKEKLNEQNS